MRKTHTSRSSQQQDLTEAEVLLKRHFAQNSENFLEQNQKIYDKKADRVQIKFIEGRDALAQAENDIMMEIYRLNQELSKIRTKKTELERFREAALDEARAAKEESAREFLHKQESIIKTAIDKQLKHAAG
jgi:hypothetical protein